MDRDNEKKNIENQTDGDNTELPYDQTDIEVDSDVEDDVEHDDDDECDANPLWDVMPYAGIFIIGLLIGWFVMWATHEVQMDRFVGKYNPAPTEEVMMDLFEETFTPAQFVAIDEAIRAGRYDIAVSKSFSKYEIIVYDKDGEYCSLKGDQIATMSIWWRTTKNSYGVLDFEWAGGCSCGCAACAGECVV